MLLSIDVSSYCLRRRNLSRLSLLDIPQGSRVCARGSTHNLSTISSSNAYRNWDKVTLPTAGQIIAYDRLPDKGTAGLPKLAVLKVNGGLGTTMGGLVSPRYH